MTKLWKRKLAFYKEWLNDLLKKDKLDKEDTEAVCLCRNNIEMYQKLLS